MDTALFMFFSNQGIFFMDHAETYLKKVALADFDGVCAGILLM